MKITGNCIIDNDISEIISENLNWSYFAGKTILVTGANGMLPAYIVYTLIGLNESILKSNPCKILALVRNREKSLLKFENFIKRDDFSLLVKDVSTFSACEEKIHIIIHAASQASPKYYGVDPVGTLKANTLGTMNLLELARKNCVKKFVFISSGEVYGVLDGSKKNIDESYTGNVDITNVRSCYAEGKRMGENMCVCYSHQYNIHVNMLRLCHTYGPGCAIDDGRVFGDFVQDVVNNRDICLNSDGSAKRSFLYVTDMIRALFYILLNAKTNEAFNIASEKETSILDLANLLCSLFPEKGLKVKLSENKQIRGYIKSASTNASYNIEKLKSLGWNEKVSVREGFKRMILSYGV